MKTYWNAVLFTFWLLSQTLGFALPAAMSGVAGQEVPSCLPGELSQTGSHGYDAALQSGLGYDAEFPPAMTQGLSDPVGTMPTIPAYDTCSVPTTLMTGAPRARPVVGVGFVAAKTGATLADDLAAAATRARTTVGPGSGGAYGTRVHTAFEAEVQGLNQGLSTEISYLNGQVVTRGTPGSVRLDVVNGPLNAPVSIFDLKTGSATLTPARIQQIQSHIPGGANVPVFPVRP